MGRTFKHDQRHAALTAVKHLDLASSGLSLTLSNGVLMVTMRPKEPPKEWGGEWPRSGLLLCSALPADEVQKLRDFMQ